MFSKSDDIRRKLMISLDIYITNNINLVLNITVHKDIASRVLIENGNYINRKIYQFGKAKKCKIQYIFYAIQNTFL